MGLTAMKYGGGRRRRGRRRRGRRRRGRRRRGRRRRGRRRRRCDEGRYLNCRTGDRRRKVGGRPDRESAQDLGVVEGPSQRRELLQALTLSVARLVVLVPRDPSWSGSSHKSRSYRADWCVESRRDHRGAHYGALQWVHQVGAGARFGAQPARRLTEPGGSCRSSTALHCPKGGVGPRFGAQPARRLTELGDSRRYSTVLHCPKAVFVQFAHWHKAQARGGGKEAFAGWNKSQKGYSRGSIIFVRFCTFCTFLVPKNIQERTYVFFPGLDVFFFAYLLLAPLWPR